MMKLVSPYRNIKQLSYNANNILVSNNIIPYEKLNKSIIPYEKLNKSIVLYKDENNTTLFTILFITSFIILYKYSNLYSFI
jgi:hypothetical protein